MSELKSHLREIGGGAMVAFAMKALSFAATFLLSVVVARLLGAESAGLFFLSLTIVTIATTLTRLGLDKPLVRHVAGFDATADRESIRGLVAVCLLMVAIAASLTAIGIGASADRLAVTVFSKPQLAESLRAMAWSITPLALAGVISLAYQGLRQIASHLLLFTAVTPTLVLVLIAINEMTRLQVPIALLYSLGCGVTLAAAIAAWFPVWGWPQRLPRRSAIEPFLASSRVTLVAIAAQLLMLWAPTVLLGVFSSSEEVARFHAAGRTAPLIGFVLIAINSIAAPKFAALYATGRLAVLEQTARQTTRIMTLTSLPITAVFMIWPERILTLFGSDFAPGAELLQILATGQFVNTVTGSVANLLLMTGHERDYRNICLLGAALGVAAGVLAIPWFGAIGAAWVTAGTLVLINLLAAAVVNRRLGFTGIGWFSSDR